MPIVQSKRKRQIEEELVRKAKRCKLNHHEMFSKIGYTEDYHHSLYREIPLIGVDFDKVVRKEVGSFLNGSGGIIAFGVRSNGTILGNKLTRKEEDNFKLALDRIMVGFHPVVKPSMYRLMIEPVYDKYNSWVGSGLCLIQLKINKGEPYCLYEDLDHEVHIRQGSGPKGPLTAREIKDRVTAEYEQRCRENKGKETQMKGNTIVQTAVVPKKGKDEEKKRVEMKTTKVTLQSVVTVPRNTGPSGQGREEKKKMETKTTKEITTTVKMAPKTTTIKIAPKTNDTVKQREKKAVTKTTSASVKIRRPLATKN